jgi:hypothetical protein
MHDSIGLPNDPYHFSVFSRETTTIDTLVLLSHTCRQVAMAQKSKKSKVALDPQPEDFERLGAVIMGRAESGSATFGRTFLDFFGVDHAVCAEAWRRCEINPDTHEEDKDCEPKHLLWGLLWLKSYATEAQLCKLASVNINQAVDPKDFREKAQLFAQKIANLHPDVVSKSGTACSSHSLRLLLILFVFLVKIVWENRKLADKGNDCLVSVDCSDCKTQKRGKSKKAFWSFKFRSSGLRYEIGICILTGEIVWINGPFPCGDWPDITIFRHDLKHFLGVGERVEADDGYVGEDPLTTKVPSSGVHFHGEAMLKMRQRVRSRHETVNKRIKQFTIVRETFRHDLTLHGDCFYACAVLTQLMIKSGHPLFQVEDYED